MMNYSKAQMVSVDDSLVALPLVFVTVTKQVTINVDTERVCDYFKSFECSF